MLYITGVHALNLPCKLNTTGDWHASSLGWVDMDIRESTRSIYKDWGIEEPIELPTGEVYRHANHLRAILDLLETSDKKTIKWLNWKNDYGENKKLKVEVSYREKVLSNTVEINDIFTFTIPELCIMKITAYLDRDKIRDLFDITYIGIKYWEELDDLVKSMLRKALEHKGLEHFDYIVKTQEDELIDKGLLADSLLLLMNKLKLIG